MLQLEVLVPITLVLIMLCSIYYNSSGYNMIKDEYNGRRKLEAEVYPPILMSRSKHRGARYNITAIRENLRNKNSTLSRFITTPLKKPPIPTASSCQLVNHNLEHKILLFVDYPFFNHFLNWLAHYQDVCGSDKLNRLEIVCMDHAVVDKVEDDAHLQCSPHSFLLSNASFHFKHQIVWRYRMTIIIKYLQNDVSLLLSDLDALWRNDPYPDFVRHLSTGHQIVASRGLWPQNLSDRWGAAVCMGFIFIRSSPSTVDLMGQVLNEMHETTPDDQKAINMILYERKIIWSSPRLPFMVNPKPDFGWIASQDNENKLQNTSIALLPHDMYMRNCSRHRSRAIAPILSNRIRQRIAHITVAHCVAAPGNAYKKFLHLQYMGMWHEGVPVPLKNETSPVLPTDSMSHKMRRARTYNSSTIVLSQWHQEIEKEMEALGNKNEGEEFRLKNTMQMRIPSDNTPDEDMDRSPNDNLGPLSISRSQTLSLDAETAKTALLRSHGEAEGVLAALHRRYNQKRPKRPKKSPLGAFLNNNEGNRKVE